MKSASEDLAQCVLGTQKAKGVLDAWFSPVPDPLCPLEASPVFYRKEVIRPIPSRVVSGGANAGRSPLWLRGVPKEENGMIVVERGDKCPDVWSEHRLSGL